MLVKLFGTIDFIVALIFIFGTKTKLPTFLLIVLAVILLLKASLGQLKDFASWIDFAGGIIFIISIFVILPGAIYVIIGILSLQKSIFSFL